MDEEDKILNIRKTDKDITDEMIQENHEHILKQNKDEERKIEEFEREYA